MSRPFASAWRQGRLVDDDFFAAAYESLGGDGRAGLKLCIARLHRIFGEAARAESLTRHFEEGFCLRQDSRAADWALVACRSDCPSPAALLAVVMPALLAGLRHLRVCFCPQEAGQDSDAAGQRTGRLTGTGTLAAAAPLLTALELAGVEEACLATTAELAAELERAAVRPRGGRIVCLGEAATFAPLALAALKRETPFMLLPADPAGAGQKAARPIHNDDHQAVRHDDDHQTVWLDDDHQTVWLDDDHQRVWIWPELTPDWFRNKSLKLYTESRS